MPTDQQQTEKDARAKNRARRRQVPQSTDVGKQQALSQIERDIEAKNRARGGNAQAAGVVTSASNTQQPVDSKLEQDKAAKRAARRGQGRGERTAASASASSNEARPGAVATTGGSRTGKASRRTAEESAAARQRAQEQMDPDRRTALGVVEEDAMTKATIQRERVVPSTAPGAVAAGGAAGVEEDVSKIFTTEDGTHGAEKKISIVSEADNSAAFSDNGGGGGGYENANEEPPEFFDEPPVGDNGEYAGLRSSVMHDEDLVTAADVTGGEKGSGIQAFVAEPEVVEAGQVALLPTVEEEQALERQQLRKYMLYGGCCFIIMAVVIIVPLVVVLGKDEDPGTLVPSTSPSLQPSLSPSSSPTSGGLSQILQYLADNEISNTDELRQVGSPPYKAAEWMADVDELSKDYNIFANENEEKWIQRYRVVLLYYATNGPQWDICGENSVSCAERYGDWLLPTESECEWFGIGCDENLNIISLTTIGDNQFRGNNWEGQVPEELYDLTTLKSLSIHGNKLSGTISTSITKLSNLATLNLHSNYLTGTFPMEEFFASVTGLTLLFAVFNNPELEGTIPTSIGLSSTLERFQVDHTQMSGDIPDEFYEMTNLKRLEMEQCDFSGTISSKFNQLTKLAYASLNNNAFTGIFPSLTATTALKDLSLHDNDFEGTLSTTFCSLANLGLNKGDFIIDCDKLECPGECQAKCKCFEAGES